MANSIINLTQGVAGNTGITGATGTSFFNYNNNIINTSTPYDFVLPIGKVDYNNNGTETKLSFNNVKGTLCLGQINNTNWNNSNQGIASLNIGLNNFSSGNYSLIHGSFNSITGTNSILSSLNSNISNSSNCILFNGSSNSINNSNNTILFNSSSATNSSNSFGFGNARINHNNCFVWTDDSIENTTANNQVIFSASNGFSFDNYLNLTKGTILPLTTSNIGSSTLQFNNLFLNSVVYIKPYLTSSLIITVSNANAIFNTLNDLIVVSRQIVPFSSTVSLSINNLYLSNGSLFSVGTTTHMVLNATNISLYTNIEALGNPNLGSPSNRFINVFTKRIACNDSFSLKKTSSQTVTTSVAFEAVPIIWHSTPLTNNISNKLLLVSSTRIANISGTTRRFIVSLNVVYNSNVNDGQYAISCSRFNSANFLLNKYHCLGIRQYDMGGGGAYTILNGHGIIELTPNDYIVANIIPTLGRTTVVFGTTSVTLATTEISINEI